MNAMNAIAKRSYALGWLLFIFGLIERMLINSDHVHEFATMHNVMPHNLLQLSFMLFVIAIASRACYSPDKA
jgi:hypothetical protein